MQIYRLIQIFLTMICAYASAAQSDSIQLKIKYLDSNQDGSIVRKAAHQLDAHRQLNAFIRQLHEQTFITASVDTIWQQDSGRVWQAYVWKGAAYRWAWLRQGNVPSHILEQTGFRSYFFIDKPFNTKQVNQIYERILQFCENHGYPFAVVRLDSVEVDSATVAASLYLDKGELFTIKDITLEPIQKNGKIVTANIHKAYLSRYLGLKMGSMYDESTIQKLQTRLNALPFLQTKESPFVVFADGKADIHLFLQSKRASRFDFLLGLQPNSNATTTQRQFTLTGNALVDLVNSFGRGERLMASWQQFKVGTSQLKTKIVLPYLMGLPVGVDAAFDIYKRDSTYVDIVAEMGVQYLLEGGNYVKFFWKNTTTNITNIDTTFIKTARRLPNVLDLQNNWFGIEYYTQRLDYRFNPRKGIEAKINASAGIKRIRKNLSITGLADPRHTDATFEYLYDSLALRSYQVKWQGELSYYIPIARRATLLTKLQTGGVLSSSALYQNELFRIGGTRTQRGFDEESIFSSAYGAITSEGRYLLSQNSYLFLFGDAAFIQNKSVLAQSQNIAISAGVGMALETKVGIFGLSYALGTQLGNPLLVRNAKIHFGYVSLF